MLRWKLARQAAAVLLAGSLMFIPCEAAASAVPEGIFEADGNMENETETEKITVPDTELSESTGTEQNETPDMEQTGTFDTEWPEIPDTEETVMPDTEELTEDLQTDIMPEMEESEAVYGEEGEILTETESTWLELTESEEMEMESESEQTEEIEEAEMDISLAKADLPPSGKPVVGASGWTAASMKSGFSPDFFPVRFYSGISSMQVFNNSGSVLLHYYDGRPTFYPTKGGQGGKFGVIYKKVLYDGNRWYDLKITVADYTTSVRSDGGEMQKSFPFIGFMTGAIGWRFNCVLGEAVMKCEIQDSVTGAPGRLNMRFQWWDIDAAQRFGLRLIDGSVRGRYYNASGSTVYYQNNVNIAGNGMEIVAGPATIASNTDPAYCVAYELAGCSSYYMGIGVRDHIEYDENSYGKNTLKRLNSELAAGIYSGMAEELRQTDTSLSKIHTPAPVKSVSNDGKVWAEKNTLPDINSTYLYQIRQFVPWQDENAYYESFVIKDVLPAGADYAGNVQMIREEDGADVTDWFTVSSDKNVVLAAANSTARSSVSFYGYHYNLRFGIKINTVKMKPVYNGNQAEYLLKNQAQTIVKHRAESNYITEDSNAVTTLAFVGRVEHTAPEKSFDENRTENTKILKMADETITYSVFQDIPVNNELFLPVKIEMTDILEECLQFEGMEVKWQKDKDAQWETLDGWDVQTLEQKIWAARDYDVKYGGGTLRFDIACRIRRNYNLSPWKGVEKDQSIWAMIPNRAAVTFEWSKGMPLRVTKESNAVTAKLREIHLRLIKEIDMADIVWAHGNPTFTFRVEGTDLNGTDHIYYQTQEFRIEDAGQGEKVRLISDFVVPAGTYRATEEKTMRYRLKNIYDIENGSVLGETAEFDLSNGQDGSAVFYNVKVTDEGESHAAFAKNHIGN